MQMLAVETGLPAAVGHTREPGQFLLPLHAATGHAELKLSQRDLH